MAESVSNAAPPLINFYREFRLTREQEAFVFSVERFLQRRTPAFYILKGYAGTGKTTLLRGLVSYLRACGRHVVLMAPTGRAAKVMRERIGTANAQTIHSTIYSNVLVEEIRQEGVVEKLVFYFKLQENDDPIDTVYIIDEASMISDHYNSTDRLRFGSGFLLTDLLDYIRISDRSSDRGVERQVIFVGDPAQLPPVRANHSPALDPQYLRKNFRQEAQEHYLREVVRQEGKSGILYYASHLRESIEQRIYNELDFSIKPFNDVRVVAHSEDVLSLYFEQVSGPEDLTTAIIAYTNQQVHQYNQIIRSRFFPHHPALTVGDKILVTQNNYKYNLFNGDIGFVHAVRGPLEVRQVNLKRKKGTRSIRLYFRDVTLAFPHSEGDFLLVNCKVLENMLNRPEPDLLADELVAIYVDFRQRHPGLKERTEAFRKALQEDEYFNAVRIKYGYAMTCHKAQGSEWPTVFVDYRAVHGGVLNESFFRWAYTATSRARQMLFVVNNPAIRLDKKLERVPTQRPSGGSPSSGQMVPPVGNVPIEVPPIPPDIHTVGPLNEEVAKLVWALTYVLQTEGISIGDFRFFNYEIHFSAFSETEGKADMRAYFNKKGMISRVMGRSQPEEGFTLRVKKLLAEALVKRPVRIRSSEPVEEGKEKAPPPAEPKRITFPSDKPFLRQFYERIRERMHNRQIEIVSVKHAPYVEIYTFRRGKEQASVSIYYNKRCEFTKVEERYDLTAHSSWRLLDDVMEELTL